MSEEECAPATQVANTLSEFINIVAVLASASAWQRYCLTTAAAERKPVILRELSALASLRPLLDLPSLHGPKEMVRRALDAAPGLERLVSAWDGEGEPSAVMTAWASGFLAGLGLADCWEHLPPPA